MTTIDLDSYQLFSGGFKVFNIPNSPRVLVRDLHGLWFKAERKDGTQFSPVYNGQKTIAVGSLSYIQDLCQRFTTPEIALAAAPWLC